LDAFFALFKYNDNKKLIKKIYIPGVDEFKRRERYNSAPRYLYRSTNSSFFAVLAGTIFIRLQRSSIRINVRNKNYIISSLKSSYYLLREQIKYKRNFFYGRGNNGTLLLV